MRPVAKPLEYCLNPSSIAIFGASDDPNKVGGRVIHYLKRFGFQGRIFPINHKRSTVQGLPCFASLASIGEKPELAVISLGAQAVDGVLEECGSAGVECVLIMSSGFAETGDAGGAHQARIVSIARRHGMRIIGPNAQGIANFGTGTVTNFSTMFMEIAPEDGPIAIVSQSGAACAMPYALLRSRGYGVRYVMATGNDADATAVEMAHVALNDGFIRVILLYIEAVQHADRLAALAARAREHGVALIALKSGSSAKGQAAALSHTGALATEDAVVSAFFERHGIYRVRDIHELVNAVPLYLQGRDPGRGHTLVMSHSGAVGVVCADLAERLDLPLPDLRAETTRRLREVLPSFGTAHNPLDLTATLLSDSSLFARALEVLAQAPEIDVLHIGMPVAGQGYDVEGFADAAARIGERVGKPLVVSGPQEDILRIFAARGLPVYRNDSDALRAILQYASHRRRLAAPPAPLPPAVALPKLDTAPPGAPRTLSEHESLDLLASGGIPVVERCICETPEEAVAAFETFAGPCVLKGCSPHLPHKSEYGLVWLDLATPHRVREAFGECLARMRDLGVEGRVLVSRMERGQRELVIGARRDPAFGPVVLVGDGGKYVEILKDNRLLIAPLGVDEAAAAFKSLRVGPILEGARGEEPVDVEALSQAARALGELMIREPAILSIDMNPILARANGALVLDALVTFEGEIGAGMKEAAE